MESKCINPSIIDSHEWAQELKRYLDSCTEKYFLNWCKIVIELGVNEIEMDKWVDIFKGKIEERYEDLVEDVSEMKSKLLDDITELMAKTCKYANELGLKEDLQDINPNERLYLVRKELTGRMERLSHIMEERQREIKDLLDEQQELCNMLERTPYKLSVSPLPHREEIEKVRHFVESLEQEKFDREERYLSLKTAIGKMAQELELAPKTDFERDILSATKKNFDITDTNMKNLQSCHDNMVQQLVSVKEEVEHLRKTLDGLWEILEESITKRHSFHQQFDGYTVATLQALRGEVKRCEELKKANIKVFVEKFRSELRELWRTCFHLNEENQQGYQWLTSDFYTEDLLTYHEMEMNKWKNFYSENEKLIKLFTEHQALWSHLLEMENKNSAGLNRYKNRGGHLLQEEKERNKLSKKIPLLEEKIKQHAVDYEELKGAKFLIFGTPIMEYIENLHVQRDQERKIKLSERKQVREQETLTPAKSCLSIFPSTSKLCLTPQPSTTKRKLFKFISNGKKTKVESSLKAKVSKTLRSVEPEMINRSRKLSLERNQRLKRCRRDLNMKMNNNNKENLNETNATNYDAFERNISTRDDNWRSTLKPNEIPARVKMVPELNIVPCTPKSNLPNTPKQQKLTTPNKESKLTRTPSSLKLIF